MIAKLFRILTLLALAVLAIGGVRTIFQNHDQNIGLTPLTLDAAHPGMRRIGALIFLAAWELKSANSDFGGMSALTVLPDRRFVGVSDGGTLIGFGLTNNVQADRPFIAPLPGSFSPNMTFRDRDTEGMTQDHDSGQFWISYESHHAIRRFSRSFSRCTGEVELKGKYKWPNNKGVEAIIRLRDGRFVAIGENLEGGKHEGLLFSGDPVEPGTTLSRFDYRPPAGYRVTDGALLPDGRLLVLNRRIGFPEGFSTKLAIVDVSDIASGASLAGTVIATLAPPLLIDNMEGIAVTREGSDTVIWLVSDNNFSIWQRTLLMKFKLPEEDKKKPEASPAPGFDSL